MLNNFSLIIIIIFYDLSYIVKDFEFNNAYFKSVIKLSNQLTIINQINNNKCKSRSFH